MPGELSLEPLPHLGAWSCKEMPLDRLSPHVSYGPSAEKEKADPPTHCLPGLYPPGGVDGVHLRPPKVTADTSYSCSTDLDEKAQGRRGGQRWGRAVCPLGREGPAT